MRAAFVLLCLAAGASALSKSDDEIYELPGVTFQLNFKQYSGYLDASVGNHLHYWLFESQSNPSQAPLVLWLNGGPGCSSLGGLFTEHGPFHPTKDGKHVEENVFSWNKVANMLYIESPRNIGFSYRDSTVPTDSYYDDAKTASDMVIALKSFFARYPEYQYRDFFVTGESYGGVYVPTLVDLLVQEINNATANGNNDLPINLKGFAIGNGEMDEYDQINSAIDLAYFRGMIDKENFESLYQCCKLQNYTADQFIYCPFTNFIDLDDFGNAVPKQSNDPIAMDCANKVANFGYSLVWLTSNDVYNTYQDCYKDDQPPAIAKKIIASSSTMRMFSNYEEPFVDQGTRLNKDSTDSLYGFPCYMDDATETYLNLPEVRSALHIPPGVRHWKDCDDDVNEKYYKQQNHDTGKVFDSIIKNTKTNLRMLFFNGDADMACNFMGDQWFIERLAARNQIGVTSQRAQWNYTRAAGLNPRGSGFAKTFSNGNITIDMLTVKGAGHYVPTDRPGPALQMFNNFLYMNDYSHIPSISTTPAKLLSQFQAAPEPQFSRREADRVIDLPGVTFHYDHRTYAGYLNAFQGNYLHYWFFESQANPSKDPLVLWLTGGPGCSGYSALLTENGPFHPNRDGETLFENAFSWNKLANVLYIESPRGVGFSYQNKTINPDMLYDDDRSARDVYLALRDFLSVFPEFVGRPFFITGESYGGIYIPSTTSLLVDKITSGEFTDLKLEGIAIGNGQLSGLLQVNAAIHMQYFHGAYGKEEWDKLKKCCPQTGDATWFEFCDFSKYIYLNRSGDVTPIDSTSECGRLIASMGQERVFNGPQEVYSLTQACYDPVGQEGNSRPNLKVPAYKRPGFVDQGILVSHESSDSQDGFQCWSGDMSRHYLSLADVQAALHVREDFSSGEYNGTWHGCSEYVEKAYTWEYNETDRFFDNIIQKGYPLRVLIYNGDVDSACNFLADQWFIERLAKRHNMESSRKRNPWIYQQNIAGYEQGFLHKTMEIDLLTVKGAGHFVPSDRPGPALQMLAAFLDKQPYSSPVPANTDLAALKNEYQFAEQVGQQDSGPKRAKRFVHDKMKTETEKEKTPRAVLAIDPPPAGTKAGDKITTKLPGFTFDFKPDMYSGYLTAAQGNYLHYWLIEADSDPTTKPLILWLNGGPGCSSLNGLMQELGPFLNNRDGETLYENVFSWHKAGNMLFLESPRDVGFSYTANNFQSDNAYSDDKTAEGNVAALIDFFNRFPEYKNRPFYITGESYAGVYIPTLTDLLVKKMAANDASVVGIDLRGLAIGNGIMSARRQINSAVSLNYFKGITGKEDYESLKKCVTDTTQPMTNFDWSKYYTVDDKGNANPINSNTSTLEGWCGREIVRQGFDMVWQSGNDVYNTFQDCYVRNPLPKYPGDTSGNIQRKKRDAANEVRRPMKYNPFVDEAKRMNYISTDSNMGYYCYDGMTPYLDKPDVLKALHIPDGLPPWASCNNDLNGNGYVQQNADTTPHFVSILNNMKTLNKEFDFLIYNGDADMACQFLGDQWFIEDLSVQMEMQQFERSSWFYKQNGNPDLGGYVKKFTYNLGKVEFNVLTVKGAGHLVPLDRPAPILQTIYNFVSQPHNQKDFNAPLPATISIERKPLLTDFTAPIDQINRRQADRIRELPGLTFVPPYAMHSGYLQASKGNYLFYWFMESQNAHIDTPVVLWLNGGPGCSSLGGLLEENGPFRPNPDGRTLFENVYSWNKAAHVLYIDSPRQVGFSYQDYSQNNDNQFDDIRTTNDLVLALEDFFVAYPQFKSKDFYTSGESYAGVYLPALTAALVNNIKAGNSTINLKGMMVGNGWMSTITSKQSDALFLYMHGVVGKSEYDALQKDCCTVDEGTLGGLRCPYEKYFQGANGQWQSPLDNDTTSCAGRIEHMIELQGEYNDNWNTANDVYNLNQDCYTQTTKSFGSRRNFNQRSFMRAVGINSRDDSVSLGQLDPLSTDSNGGFQCYMNNAARSYMAQRSVRSALHVPPQVQDWDFCNDPVNNNYSRIYLDMTDQLVTILNSNLSLHVLIYNGDVDTSCTFMQAQLLIEKIAHNLNMTESNLTEWRHRTVIAGYQKKFALGKTTLDLLTVKGSGHYVPTDRPGPALQMISAFLNKSDYSTPIPYNLDRQELLPRYRRHGDVNPDNGSTTTTGTVTPNAASVDTTTPDSPVTPVTPVIPQSNSSTPSTAAPTQTPVKTTTQFSPISTCFTSLIVLLGVFLFQ